MKLDGTWKYKKDPSDTFKPGSLDFSSSWKEMRVPSNWYLEGLEYSGTIWFWKEFNYSPAEKNQRDILKFQGIDYFASIWLNGERVGEHEGYFQPFDFDVTNFLKNGNNRLLVKVRSPKEDPEAVWPDKKYLIKGVFNHHDARPGSWDTERGQEKNTGGIWNGVKIEREPPQRITKLHVTPRLIGGGSALVRVKMDVLNLEGACESELSIELKPNNFSPEDKDTGATINNELKSGKNSFEKVIIIDEPALWWTWDHGEQNLYSCIVKLDTGNSQDLCQETFGIREISTKGTNVNSEWKLNGQRFFPRGSNIIPTQWLAEYNDEMISRDIELIKEANLNSIRVHGHVNRKEFYKACDRAGILVWQDFALQWSYEESQQFYNNARKQAQDMVEYLYNHPSIGVWCCHNEPSMNVDTLDNLLYDVVKEEDSVRIVEHHSDFKDHPYPGWYRYEYTKFDSLPGAPFVNEFGAQALPGAEQLRDMFNNPKDAWPPNWEEYAFHDFQYDQTFHVANIDLGESLEEFVKNSQNYQYKLLKFAIEKYRRNKFDPMVGIMQFMLVESWPSITWAVVDYGRKPKKGYDALKLGMQPVLPTFDVPRNKLQLGEKNTALFDNLLIVNDLHETFPEARVNVWLENDHGESFLDKEFEVSIPADDKVLVTKTNRREDYWVLPENIKAGEYYLKVNIKSNKKKIGHNKERVEVVEASKN